MLRGVIFVACVMLVACGGTEQTEEATEGTFDVVFSAPTGDPNMDMTPFSATQAHGKFYEYKQCTGTFNKTCSYAKALSFTGVDEATRNLYLFIPVTGVTAGFTATLGLTVGAAHLDVADHHTERNPYLDHTWGAMSGTFVIDAVDGDLVTFRVIAAIVKPVISSSDNPTVGTFQVDATGQILIHREI